MPGHPCIACGKWITYRFAICTDCETLYGNKARFWPDWLRFLWNDIQRERRANTRNNTHEVPLSVIDPEEAGVEFFNDQ